MDKLLFMDNPENFLSDDAFVAHIPHANGKEDLFKKLYDALKLPAYFGFNWDALSDCLNDFHWINQRQVVLVHDDVPNLDAATFDVYMDVLFDAVQSWQKDEEHFLQIVFPQKAEDIVKPYYRHRSLNH